MGTQQIRDGTEPSPASQVAAARTGLTIIFVAALVWGVGNAITGWSARKYVDTGDGLPAIDIAFANTLGGLAFLLLGVLAHRVRYGTGAGNHSSRHGLARGVVLKRACLSGALKGANTCFYVLSATYIAATTSLILESSYIILALIFGVAIGGMTLPVRRTILEASLLIVGVVLVAGPGGTEFGGDARGIAFGLGAGVTYGLFLISWALITDRLETLASRLRATTLLLAVALGAVVLFGQPVAIAQTSAGWLPFDHLDATDIIVQFLNGALVVGATYLLVTIGMAEMAHSRQAAGVLAAFALSFSIPFTLLTEVVVFDIAPENIQYAGMALFMPAFVLMTARRSTAAQGGGQ